MLYKIVFICICLDKYGERRILSLRFLRGVEWELGFNLLFIRCDDFCIVYLFYIIYFKIIFYNRIDLCG